METERDRNTEKETLRRWGRRRRERQRHRERQREGETHRATESHGGREAGRGDVEQQRPSGLGGKACKKELLVCPEPILWAFWILFSLPHI